MATRTNDLFSKLKPKLIKRQEGDGHETKVEVREDEEQSIKLQEIIDLLVAAGYFRARIKGLSSFDKIVGGMTWCIESCNVEVDVDLLFQENSTIGQKIALTEKIVAVLPKLQCPHQIEPHQIQGLDFIHVFPVIQWLVKRSMQIRSNTADFVYSFAVSQFDRDFPERKPLSQKEKQMVESIKMVKEKYKPHRIYRRKYASPNTDIGLNVQITLLEYGEKGTINQSEVIDPQNGLIDSSTKDQEIQLLMNDMTVINEESFDYNELTQKDQEKLEDHYKSLNKELKIYEGQSQDAEQVSTITERIKEIGKRIEKFNVRESLLDKEIAQLQQEVQEIKMKQQKTKSALNDLDQNGMNSKQANEIKELIILSDTLRKEEQEFRDKCKFELEKLQKSIQEARNRKSESVEVKEKELDLILQEQSEKLKAIRLQIAKKSRTNSLYQRRLDDIPNRPELTQYQKRFFELYNQISAKHKETKQYYSLYNTLEDTRLYMKKELSLLNSISESYPEAMLSKEGKEDFLQQFVNILDSVEQSKSKLNTRLLEQKRKKDELSQSFQNLVELNRRYIAAIKQLKVECQRNEELLATVKQSHSASETEETFH